MAVVFLPSLLAAEAGGRKRFELEAETVGDALRTLPVANLVLDERGELRTLVNVYIDGVDARDRDGLATKLEGAETIRLVAAIAGGSMESLRTVRSGGRMAGTVEARTSGSDRQAATAYSG